MRSILLFGVVACACEAGTNARPAQEPALIFESRQLPAASSEDASVKGDTTTDAGPPQVVAARGVNPFGSHRLFWSKSGLKLAVIEDTPCGPPGPQSTCAKDLSQLRIVELGGRRKDDVVESATVFGWRADGETLVIRRRDLELVDWSTKTRSGRTSDWHLATRGAEFVCLSPDDVHFVAVDAQGAVTYRSRLTTDVVQLVLPTTGSGAPSDCAFSPSGKAFALEAEGTIAVYAAGKSNAVRSIRMSGVGQLAWSTDERLVTFGVPDVLRADGSGLFYVWDPERDHAQMYAGSVAADLDPKRRQILMRGGCTWKRISTEGHFLGADKLAGEPCFHVHEHEVAVSPNGAFVAAAEGEWGGSTLVLRSLL